MAQTKHQIQSLLQSIDAHPRHRFGQNFMIDGNLLRLVADAGGIVPGDAVLEVGPGTGTLTEELLARGAEVLAVEIDRDLAGLLRTRFADNPHFTLIEGDALAGKHAINPEVLAWMAARRADFANRQSAIGNRQSIRLVANLPYNIASPLVIELLIAGVDTLAFTVQKEVAERMRAAADSEAYGPLSVMAQLLAKVEVLRTLPKQAFWPMPTIDSALVKMTRDDRLGDSAAEMGRFVHQLFASRRKTLGKALAVAGYGKAIISQSEKYLFLQRPEVLTPAEFMALFENKIPTKT